MINRNTILFRAITRKGVTVFFIAAFSVAAFATLGDGKSKGKKKSLLANKTTVTPGHFSLKSGYQYRGSHVLTQQTTNNTITLNSLVTYQKGNITYIVPLKTTVFTQKSVKVGVGIPMLNRN